MMYLGKDVPIADLTAAVRVTEPVLKNVDPFDARISQLDYFPPDPDGMYPIIGRIDSPDLLDLRSRLADAFDQENVFFSKRHPEYSPHVTLAYAKEPGRTEALERDIEWTVNELVLWGGDSRTERFVVRFSLPPSRPLTSESRLARLVAEARDLI
jgi:2'-5' RNA ligase